MTVHLKYASLNILRLCFNVVIRHEPPPRLSLDGFQQVPFIESTIMPVIRAERKIVVEAANAQLTID